MSWFDSIQTGHACGGSAASVASTTPRIAAGVERREREREVEREMELVLAAPVEAREPLELHHPGLAEQHALGLVLVDEPAPASKDLVHVVTVGVVGRDVGIGIVAQFAVLDDAVSDVDAKAGDPAVEPEAHDLVECGSAPPRSTS